jgi:hypothetical protein
LSSFDLVIQVIERKMNEISTRNAIGGLTFCINPFLDEKSSEK